MNDQATLDGLKERIEGLLQEKFKGRPARLANAAGVGTSTTKHWFDKWKAGERVSPNGLALFKVAQACGVSVEWLLTGEGQGAATAEPAEVERLKTDLAEAEESLHKSWKNEGDAIASRSRLQEKYEVQRGEVDELKEANERLQNELLTSGLSKPQEALLEEIRRALRLPEPLDPDQVLLAVAASYRVNVPAASVHEPKPKKSGAGGKRGRQAS